MSVSKIEVVKSQGDYCQLDWSISFKCTCNNCLKSCIVLKHTISFFGLQIETFKLDLQHCLVLKLECGHINLNELDQYRIIIGVKNKTNTINFTSEYKNLKSSYKKGCPIVFLMGRQKVLHTTNNFLCFNLSLSKSNIQSLTCLVEEGLTISIEVFKLPLQMVVLDGEKCLSSIATDVASLRKNEAFSDIIFVVDNQEFYLHKAILASRSTVFYAMFENKMQEKLKNKVVINDISAKVMEQVFNYIYTDSIAEEDCKELVDDILAAADKYNLQGLLKICEKILIEIINIKNILYILAKAYYYKLETLKKIANDFILGNVGRLIETDELKVILEASKLHLLKVIDKQ